MGRKHRCEACERERLEERELRMMDSWLCVHYEDVWCPHFEVPKEKRMDSVCFGCSHFEECEHEMEREEEEEDELFEAVLRDPDAWLMGEI
jgi:hypothetical protein